MKLLRKILPVVFTSDEARFFLRERYKAPLEALSSIEKSGEIVRLRRGLYAFKEGFDPLMAAARIHGPSYVSFETALDYYGLIPERVHQIISVVDGRPASYLSDSVRYVYHSQQRLLFSKGMGLIFIRDEPVPIALPEKAILDTLANHKLKTAGLSGRDVLDFVIANLRIAAEDLDRLSLKKLKDMAPLYRNLGPGMLVQALNQRREK